MGIGERLTQERKRLGLSQTDFAKHIGVSLSSQKRYESGDRSPDAEYLNSVGHLGIDIPYLITGIPTSVDTLERRVLIRLLDRFGQRLGINIWGEIDDVAWNEEIEWATNNPPQLGSGFLNIPNEEINNAVDKKIDEALATIGIDEELLASIIEAIEAAIIAGKQITPTKKARATVMLYRAFKLRGKVDKKMVDETIALASSLP